MAYHSTLDPMKADQRARRRGAMLLAGGMVLLGALWIAGNALSLMPSLALSPAVSPAVIVSAQRAQDAQNVSAASVAQNMPTETQAATSGSAPPNQLAAGSDAMAEDTDGTPLPQRRFLIEARADPIFGAEPDQPLAAAQEAETTASGTAEQAAAAEPPAVKRAKSADRRAKPAPPPRRHVSRARAGPRSHVSRRPPSLRKIVRQITPLRSLRVGGLRVF